MCGIVGILGLQSKPETLRTKVLDMSKSLRHRGPDWSGIFMDDKVILGHERLAIVDPISGGQPIVSNDGHYVLAANGEIYNHRELKESLFADYDFKTASDCEVIIALYDKFGDDFKEGNIYRIRFTDLLEWILELPNFEGKREDCSEGHLEMIQAKWVYEWRENQ